MTKDKWIKEVLDILHMIDTTAVNRSDYQAKAKALYEYAFSQGWQNAEAIFSYGPEER